MRARMKLIIFFLICILAFRAKAKDVAEKKERKPTSADCLAILGNLESTASPSGFIHAERVFSQCEQEFKSKTKKMAAQSGKAICESNLDRPSDDYVKTLCIIRAYQLAALLNPE